MRIFKIAIVLVFSLLLLTGCHSKLEDYGYKSTKNEFSWGWISVKLKGNEKNYGRTAIRSTPYRLNILFQSDKFLEGVIHISELKLVNNKNKMVVFELGNIIDKSFQKAEHVNTYLVYFSFKDIDLEYEEMLLQLKFTLKQGNKSTEYKTEILFEKNYRKFRRIIGA